MNKINGSCFLAIDPGREKTGMAILQPNGDFIWHAIVPSESIINQVSTCKNEYDFNVIIIGNGTSSKSKQKLIQENFKECSVIAVNEYRTTDEARKLYFKINPPKGFKRLIPLGMQTPPCPIDDYAAIIIGRKYLQSKNK